MSNEELCGATRDFGLGTEWEGRVVAICERPTHSRRTWHNGEAVVNGKRVGVVTWQGDDRRLTRPKVAA